MSRDVTEQELYDTINHYNLDDSTDGLIVQLPLPKNLNHYQAITSVKWSKDVDGFHPYNLGRLAYGMETFTPATVSAVKTIIAQELGFSWLRGKKVCIVGRSDHICKPLQYWLQNGVSSRQVPGGDATVTCVHEYTRQDDLFRIIYDSDLIITATGRNEVWLTGDDIKDNAVIIDVAFNRNPITKKVYGDVDVDSCLGVASKITPVPGGVGPITVAELMRNVVQASSISHKNKAQLLETSSFNYQLLDPEKIPVNYDDGLVSDDSILANSKILSQSIAKSESQFDSWSKKSETHPPNLDSQ